MIRKCTLTALTIVTASFVAGAPAFADGDLTVGSRTPPPPPPGALKAEDPGRQRSTTCEGDVGCSILRAACNLVDGTYSEWKSPDHGHPHGICTWPWE